MSARLLSMRAFLLLCVIWGFGAQCSDVIQLDLSLFVNNRGLGDGANYDGLGHGFVCAAGEGFQVGAVPFARAPAEHVMDNIVSFGQVVTLPHEPLGALYLLAAASHGPVSTKMSVTYRDGSMTTTSIHVPDWQDSFAFAGSRIDASPCRVSTDATGALYLIPVFVDPSKRASHLTFPYTGRIGWFQPTLHVHAITAYKARGLTIVAAEVIPSAHHGTHPILRIRLHNTGSAWIQNCTLTAEGPLLSTRTPATIHRLAPGNRIQVDIVAHTLRREPKVTPVTIKAWQDGAAVATSQTFPLLVGPTDYEPIEASLQTHRAPSWLEDAKFGIFIHWGLYAVPAWAPVGQSYAEWYWWQLMQGGPTKDHHRNVYGKGFEYDDFLDQWDASEFDPHDWLRLIDEAHARYFVFTTKHHDGITLFDTNTTHRSTVRLTKHHTDYVSELINAAENSFPHIKRGLYFSMPEWYHPSYRDKTLGWHGPPQNAYTRRVVTYTGSPPVQDFVNQVQVPQLLELVRNYDPDILWCDIGGINNSTVWQSAYFNQALANGREVAINDRCGNGISDFHTLEYSGVRGAPSTRLWEATRGIDPYSFGYNRATQPHQYATATELIRELVEIVAKGGNFLLNIGPEASGRVPGIMADRLRAMGAWLDRNGASIFGTEAYWVATEDTSEPGQPLRFTQDRNHTTLYVHSLKRPLGQRLVIKAPVPTHPNAVITMLPLPNPLEWRLWDNGRLIIQVPETVVSQGEHVWVFAIHYP